MINTEVQMYVERLARRGRTDFYERVAELAGLSLQNWDERNELSDMLGEISRQSYVSRRVLVSAVIVTMPPSGTGFPGEGFFMLARELEAYTGESQEAAEAFWVEEVARVFAAYR